MFGIGPPRQQVLFSAPRACCTACLRISAGFRSRMHGDCNTRPQVYARRVKPREAFRCTAFTEDTTPTYAPTRQTRRRAAWNAEVHKGGRGEGMLMYVHWGTRVPRKQRGARRSAPICVRVGRVPAYSTWYLGVFLRWILRDTTWNT